MTETSADKLAALLNARHGVSDAGRPEAVAKRRAAGMATARERIGMLVDSDSFREIGGLVEPDRGHEMSRDLVAPADGALKPLPSGPAALAVAPADGAAARRAPDDALVYYELCQLQLMRRNKEGARASCLEAQQRGDRYVPGMLFVAQMWLMNDEWSQAEELLKALQEEHPDDFHIGALLVRANVVGGRLQEDQEALDAWLKHPGGKTPRFKLLQAVVALASAAFDSAGSHGRL